MLIFIVISIIVLLQKYKFKHILKDEKVNKAILIALCLIFIYSWLDIDSSPVDDLFNYNEAYYRCGSLTYIEFFSGIVSNNFKDPFYYLIGKIFFDLGFSFNGWRIIIGICLAISMTFFIYQYSKNLCLSYVIILSLFLGFTFTGLRQTLALSFVLFSYRYIEKQKFLIFILYVVLGSLFHSTAIYFLPTYWFSKFDWGNRKRIYFLIIMFLCVIFGEIYFRRFISLYSIFDIYKNYSIRSAKLTWSGYIIQLIILLSCMYPLKFKTNERSDIIFINVLLLGTCIQGFSTIIAEFFRLSYYFCICSIANIPNAIAKIEDKKTQKIITFITFIIFILYIFWTRTYSHFKFF